MQLNRLILVGVLCLSSIASGRSAQLRPDPPIVCGSCDAWNAPREPFCVFGNTYYVGVAGLSAVLVTSAKGHILLDAGLPQSAAAIDAHVRQLGFRTEDIQLIVNSHAHFDHAGGIAAMQRATHAIVAASAAGGKALERGEPTVDDPQYAYGRASTQFPRVASVRVVADGESLKVGELVLTAHLTPGHTPGSTSWTWRSCEGARCLDVVYADSLTAVSAPGFRFSGDKTHPSLVNTFQRSISRVAQLPCDVLISVHPEFSDMNRKLALRAGGSTVNPFVDSQACRTYAANARQALDRRVLDEK